VIRQLRLFAQERAGAFKELFDLSNSVVFVVISAIGQISIDPAS
jgi:hypothetical protein